jgi:hypothetical protein
MRGNAIAHLPLDDSHHLHHLHHLHPGAATRLKFAMTGDAKLPMTLVDRVSQRPILIS